MSIDIKITNPHNGLSKVVNADSYTKEDYLKTFKAYVAAGYSVKIIEGVRHAE